MDNHSPGMDNIYWMQNELGIDHKECDKYPAKCVEEHSIPTVYVELTLSEELQCRRKDTHNGEEFKK